MSNKKCKKCNETYPATSDYFYKDRKNLRTSCRSCHIAVVKRYQSFLANSQSSESSQQNVTQS
jgi:hypothetical protein